MHGSWELLGLGLLRFTGMLALSFPLLRRLPRLFPRLTEQREIHFTFPRYVYRLYTALFKQFRLDVYFVWKKKRRLCWNNNRGQVVKNATEIIVMLRVKFCSCLWQPAPASLSGQCFLIGK